ncbi:MAG TPA: DNA starvation/stationary phase protection protein [Patescibacteria group bacterium]|nr:DNA starvation/stationary phase protection protein [Patescibacteria group bacterium]
MPSASKARTAASSAGATTTALQESLVELIDLSLQAKHYHWTVTGQEFRGVHLHLDEITDQVRLWYDEVAERLATLDVAPDGRLSTVATGTPLPAAGKGWQKDVTAVTAMRDRLAEVAGRLERRAGDIGDSDLVTQGILLEIAGGLQKHAWMLRVQAR